MEFSSLYYGTAVIGILFIPILSISKTHHFHRVLRATILALLIFVYLVGMSRVSGVDMQNYIYAYEYSPELIPDIGFQLIIKFYSWLELPFLIMMLSIAVINIFAVFRLANYYKLSFGLLLLLWFLHIVVIRDFAQLRISLAVSFAILGLTSKSSVIKIFFYLTSVSIHLTAIFFITAYEICTKVALLRSKFRQYMTMLLLISGAACLGLLIKTLSFIDPRIEIYLLWNDDSYGAPINTYNIILLHGLIIGFALFVYRKRQMRPEILTMFFMEILGVIIFLSLSQYSIFAFRLSNLTLSLYQVFLLVMVGDFSRHIRRYGDLIKVILLILFSIALIFRPGSYSIIQRMGF